MSNKSPGESYSNPNIEQLLADTLNKIRVTLGPDLAETLGLKETTTLLGVRIERYRSPTLAAAQDAMPGHYPENDRNLAILTLPQREQVIIVSGKINPTNPFDIDNALYGGVDSRATGFTVYSYDGDQTITEYPQDGRVSTYMGYYGNPEVLLSYTRHSIGEFVAFESVGFDPFV